ncbi:hypothetical protein [Paenibacillus herberti]|uniref:Uncharacterized protein n=1 Tax=Paenibacillus herberti TaxID=1619309 RepID=A0A229NY97_9BACL|nr:hypothetical protein [Paenibacillus herberti]OXM14872.1 hypothetical protein CGZ75_18575 [Paenibacillus herberti]
MEKSAKESATKGNVHSSNLGIILVLFILLVIILPIFTQPSPASDAPQVGPLSTVTFTIINSTSYPLVLNRIVGKYAGLPEPFEINPNGGSGDVYVQRQFPWLNSCTAYYYVLDFTRAPIYNIAIPMYTDGAFGSNYFNRLDLNGAPFYYFSTGGTTLFLKNK